MNIPIPPPVLVTEPGSFARYTLEQRLIPIVQRAIAENDFPPPAIARLETLAREIPHTPIRLLDDDGGPDIPDWNGYIEPFQGKIWLDLPFYWAEAYFYRRIIEAIEYFRTGTDPFAVQKARALEVSRSSIRAIAGLGSTQETSLTELLNLSLWGNRADLSLWPVGTTEDERSPLIEHENTEILVDDTPQVKEAIAGFSGERIDVILDNAGFELVCDLLAIDYLLVTGIAKTIYLHLKSHPTFVSDALTTDIHQTIAALARDPDSATRCLGERLRGFLGEGRLLCQSDFFWTSPLVFWEMPSALRAELAASRLVLIKGDANYRRLIGERQWPFTTSLQAIAAYFPASLVALRTLKSEVITGLRSTQVERLNREDPRWLIEGRKGVIQYVSRLNS
jgi:uncharacterized protein with ATP-grasp and redox domains